MIRIGLASAFALVAGCYAEPAYYQPATVYRYHPGYYPYGYGYAGGYYRYDDGRRFNEHERHEAEEHEEHEEHEHGHM